MDDRVSQGCRPRILSADQALSGHSGPQAAFPVAIRPHQAEGQEGENNDGEVGRQRVLSVCCCSGAWLG